MRESSASPNPLKSPASGGAEAYFASRSDGSGRRAKPGPAPSESPIPASAPASACDPPSSQNASEQIDAFARDLSDREAVATASAWAWLETCGSADRLYETLFIPAAIRLGEWWESDEMCFTTVTLSMAMLQRLLWSVGRLMSDAAVSVPQTRLLLAPAPGQQHTFGLNLLCEQLRARGGRPVLLACPTREELIAAVKFGGFETVGLSVACDDHLRGLSELTREMRAAAPGPMHLLLGGPLAGKLSTLRARYEVDEVVSDRPVDRLCELLFQSPDRRQAAAAAA